MARPPSTAGRLLAAVALAAHATTNTAAQPISLVESGASGRTWTELPKQSWGAASSPSVNLVIDRSSKKQPIIGFGAAFTDTSAYNAMVFMRPAVRAQYLEAMWGESGLGWSVMRVHINSPDYAFQSYNFDNVTDDFALTHFDKNLTYDQQRVIPLIRAAREVSAGWTLDPILLFGSPWSPPGWMKNNNNMINSDAVCLKNDTAAGDSYAQTWANYILLWLQSYEAQGLAMWGLVSNTTTYTTYRQRCASG